MNESEDCGFFRDNDVSNQKINIEEQSVRIPVESKDTCMYCGKIPLDSEIKSIFDINICNTCSKTELNFITKTKCMQTYLLTSEELKHFKCLSRPNPHKGTWNDMQLFIEKQIVDFAIKKHGELINIEKLKNDRKIKNKNKKLETVKKRVKELKRKTFLTKENEKHVHSFVNHGKYSICECGMKIEEEEL